MQYKIDYTEFNHSADGRTSQRWRTYRVADEWGAPIHEAEAVESNRPYECWQAHEECVAYIKDYLSEE